MKQQAGEEYYPKEVKKAITGNGNANKEQVVYAGKEIQLPDEGFQRRKMHWRLRGVTI